MLISKYGRKGLSKSKKRICNTFIPHVNSNRSNNFYTSDGDNVIETSNVHHSNAQNNSTFKTLITLQKGIDKYLSVSINDKITDQHNIIEEISSYKHLSEIIDHICYENGISL